MTTRRLWSVAVFSGLLLLDAGASLADPGDVSFHGIISQGWLDSSDHDYLISSSEGSFSFLECALNVSANVDSRTRIGAQIFARDLGHEGNSIISLDWAFGDYRWRDTLGFRVGKIKTPIGLYNTTRDIDMVRNPIFLPQSVYSEDYRDLASSIQGMSIYGVLSREGLGELGYDVFLGTTDIEVSSYFPNFLRLILPDDPMLSFEAEMKRIYGGALRWQTPLDGLRLGATWLTFDMRCQGVFATPAGTATLDLEQNLDSMYVLSAEYTRNNLILACEWQRMFSSGTMAGIPVPQVPGMTVQIDTPGSPGGWYGQATYRCSERVELGSYYSMFYADWNYRDLEDTGASQADLALTCRLDMTDFWVLKFEYHSIDGVGDLAPVFGPTGETEDTWTMFGVKSTFHF